PTCNGVPPSLVPVCQNALIDVAIFLDSSGSIAFAGWKKLINFFIDIFKLVIIGPRGIQFSFGKFSNNYTHVCNFDTYDNNDNLTQ
ncbi:unnamed protein product, partial [Candidula unifasciata]